MVQELQKGTVFWNVKEGGFGGFPASNVLQNPFFSGSVDRKGNGVRRSVGSRDNHPKRMKLMESKQAKDQPNLSGEFTPLGLTLRKTPSFLDLIETKLSEERNNTSQNSTNQSTDNENMRMRNNDIQNQPLTEKLKASNFPASLLRIGTWERVSRYEGDLVAKCYYAKRKLVWEVLNQGLKKKIEIQWSDIAAMRATFFKNEPGILEVELNHPPLYFCETDPQPRKHTLWQSTSDFTGGQATTFRRHYLQFPEGTLEKHYEKLIQYDNQLFTLSHGPFPSLNSPYFHSSLRGYQDVPFEYNGHVSEFPPSLQFPPHLSIPRPNIVPSQQVQNSESWIRSSTGAHDSISPLSEMIFPPIHGYNHGIEYQRTPLWSQGMNNNENNLMKKGDQLRELPLIAPAEQVNPLLSPQEPYHHPLTSMDRSGRALSNKRTLTEIADNLLHDPLVEYSDEQRLMAKVKSMSSLLNINESNPTELFGPDHNGCCRGNDPNDHLGIRSIEQQPNGGSGLLCTQLLNWWPAQEPIENSLMHLPINNTSYSSCDL